MWLSNDNLKSQDIPSRFTSSKQLIVIPLTWKVRSRGLFFEPSAMAWNLSGLACILFDLNQSIIFGNLIQVLISDCVDPYLRLRECYHQHNYTNLKTSSEQGVVIRLPDLNDRYSINVQYGDTI